MTAQPRKAPRPLDLGLAPDPVERLASLLRQRFGEAWVPDPAYGSSALLRTRTGRSICAYPDPATNRILLQAWVDWDWVTPTAAYTADPAGHRDLEHWLSCGDLTEAGHTMKQILQGLLDQLEPIPPHDVSTQVNPDAAERELQHLAGQARELVRHAGQFAAGLIRREPVAAPARQLARLAQQAAHTAVRVDTLRGEPKEEA